MRSFFSGSGSSCSEAAHNHRSAPSWGTGIQPFLPLPGAHPVGHAFVEVERADDSLYTSTPHALSYFVAHAGEGEGDATTRHGRPRPDAAGCPQPGRKRDRGHDRKHASPAGLAGELSDGRTGQCVDRGGGYGYGSRHNEGRPYFRRLFHDEAGRDGNGVVDLPLDCRSASRPAMGVAKFDSGEHLSVHCTGGGRRVLNDSTG